MKTEVYGLTELFKNIRTTDLENRKNATLLEFVNDRWDNSSIYIRSIFESPDSDEDFDEEDIDDVSEDELDAMINSMIDGVDDDELDGILYSNDDSVFENSIFSEAIDDYLESHIID